MTGPRGERSIEVDGLTRRFGTFTAVDAISFDVGQGEVFGFLGANGAGKTTAIRMLIGLLAPSAGSARVAGYDVATQAEMVKKNIGYMSQRFSLYEDLTVRENITLYGGIYGLSDAAIEKRTTELVDRLDLGEDVDTRVKSIPLGWKQKLAFSVAVLHDPKVVFLDEPTGGVDPITRRQFWELIYTTAAAGTTVFVTTHYMDEAEYCDRVSIMVDGRIVALGTPSELKVQYDAHTIDDVFVRLARAGNAAGSAA
jgi:drug efflux transport system ATP-binding protein